MDQFTYTKPYGWQPDMARQLATIASYANGSGYVPVPYETSGTPYDCARSICQSTCLAVSSPCQAQCKLLDTLGIEEDCFACSTLPRETTHLLFNERQRSPRFEKVWSSYVIDVTFVCSSTSASF